MSDLNGEVLRLKALRKSYNLGRPNEVEVLHGLDLTIRRSDFAALIGPSGSGKSTLLSLIGLLDKPSSGELYMLGQATSDMNDATRTALRGASIGFVFQFHHLINAFSAIDNVLMPLMLTQGKPDQAALQRVGRCWPPWVWRSMLTSSRASCPAGSNSGLPSPGR